MKKILILAVVFLQAQIIAQEKSSIFPFENLSDGKQAWLSFGLSQLISEGITAGGALGVVSQDSVFTVYSSGMAKGLFDGVLMPSFLKNHLDWKANYIVIGNYKVMADSVKIGVRVGIVGQKAFSSPVYTTGKFEKYTDFYVMSIRLMEAVYAGFITQTTVNVDRKAIGKSRDKIRQIVADYEGYQGYLKNWMVLKYYDAGIAMADAAKFDEAIAYFEIANKLDEQKTVNAASNLSKVYVLRGNARASESKADLAEKDYLAAIATDSKNSDAYYNLGNIYKDKKDYENAVTQYKKVLEINTKHFEAMINIGYVAIQEGRHGEAAAAYENALKLNEANALGHYYAGVAYDNNLDTSNAMRHYVRALELDKRWPEHI